MSTPSAQYRRLNHRVPAPLCQGLDAAVHRLAGVYRRRDAVRAELLQLATAVDAQASLWKDLGDHPLHERLMEFREHFHRRRRGADLPLVPALAAIREAAERQLGLRPFVVQLMGALALHRGFLAEMATGEGKTLTAGLAAVLAGWTKRSCHVVTVNDYLVQRDAEWMRPLYTFAGVRVGCVAANHDPTQRRHGYEADVTYVTSKEALADFLRDRLKLGSLTSPPRRLLRELLLPRPAPAADGLVMRGLHTAIVDEADSVLIDEAVTPLIISSPHKNELLEQAVTRADQVVADLKAEHHYRVDARYREIELTQQGRDRVSTACDQLPGLWRGAGRRDELIRQALVARELFHRDRHYIIVNGRIVIVDEFTGRQMAQRTWRQGLHQAIEAKEQLAISDPSETVARLSFQRFFRCFHQLSGMTGTAREAAAEFWQIYRLPVLSIPTNRPCVRQHRPDRVFLTERAKWEAIVEEIASLHATGRPLLVGTRSVAASEKLGAMLGARGLACHILNAARHEEEAAIVALAGELGRITIATNMAGRGTDIRLGPGVKQLGGLHVLATERHESGRVDRQLFGRAARQGDPGSAQALVSTEDELVSRYLAAPLRRALRRSLQGGWPLSNRVASAAFGLAQRQAQQLAYQQRQAVLRADTWLEEALSFSGPST